MNLKLIISIDDNNVHIIRVRNLLGKECMERLTRLNLDQGIVSDGTIRDPIALSGIIQEFMNNIRFKFLYEVVFLLNSSRVIIKEIQIPKVKLKNLEGTMINRIDELFPDIREFNFRYRIKEENESGFNMMVVFIPKELYNGYNDVLKSLKILKGTLDVQYSALASFVKEDGQINGEKLRDGEYLLINVKNSNGYIVHCSKGSLKRYRNIYNPSGGSELRKKILDTLYFDDFEKDRKIILLGESKDYLMKEINRGFIVKPIIAEKITFYNKEVEESEINGCLDIFSRVLSKREKKDYRVNFFSGTKERKPDKIIFKASFVLCVLLFFMLYRRNLDRALKYEMDKIESLNRENITLVEEVIYDEEKEESIINTKRNGNREELKILIPLVVKHGEINEIYFDGSKYDLKGLSSGMSNVGYLIRDLQSEHYNMSHLVTLNRNSGEMWSFEIEVKR